MQESKEWRRARCHDLWTDQNGTCFYCGITMADPLPQRIRHRKRPDAATIDHVVPRTLGGAAEWHNEVAACRACNATKSDTPPTPQDLEKLRLLKSRPTVEC
ncbi:MAG: HNH endonuclease [Magnetospirillum sp.]